MVSGSKHERVARIAEAQRGRVSRRQLLAAGLTASMIATMVRQSHLIRLHAGVYAVGHNAPLELGRETAALLACRTDALLSHDTAAALWDIRNIPDRGPPAPVHLSVLTDRARSRPGITVHRTRWLHPREIRTHKGLPVTSPARTLLDLAGALTPRELERALDEALVRRIMRLAEVLDVLDRARGRRGWRSLRSLVEARGSSTVTRSEAEERFLGLIRAAGLPAPEMNVRLHGFTVDFYWRRHGLVVEIDGYQFHSTRSAFERDRRKDMVLHANRLEVMRVSWQQLADEAYALIAAVVQALVRRETAA